MRQIGEINTKKILFSLLECFMCVATAKAVFTVIYLKQKGLSNTEIGLIFSINAFISIVGQPLWGFISDKTKSKKNVMLFCFTLGNLIYMLLLFTKSALLIGVILAFNNLFECAIESILDVWIISSEVGGSYSTIRVWGSIGYSVVVLLYGELIGNGSVKVIFPLCLIISIVTIVLCLFIHIESKTESPKEEQKRMSTRKLFGNYRYLALVGFVFLLYLPNSPAGTFLPNLFTLTGGTWAQYGIMNSLRSFTEIPALLIGSQLLKKFGHKKLLFFSAFLYLAEMVLFASAYSTVQVIVAQLLQGMAYSLFLLGSLHYIYEIAPGNMKLTAQTMVNACGTGLSAIIGNYGGGVFIDKFGIRPMFWTGAVDDAAAILLFALSFFIAKLLLDRRKNKVQV